MLVYFYALICPKSNKVRYIGRTINPLYKRLSQHIGESKYTPNKNYKTKWVNLLLQEGINPKIELLFSYIDTSAKIVGNKVLLRNTGIIEKQLIISYINAGERLTNTALVEQDYYTYSYGEEFKQKISDSQIKKVGVPITILDLKGNLLKQVDSITQASKFSKQKGERISDIAQDKRAAKKFIYVYTKEYDPKTDYSYKVHKQKYSYSTLRVQRTREACNKPIYHILGTKYTKYNSVGEAAIALNINRSYIGELANGSRKSSNFKFSFTEPPV